VVIFDCNGVLVDSEPLATAIVSQEFMRAGFPLTPDIVARYFTGRRPTDMFAEVEAVAGRKLPPDFATTVATATLRRFRAELRATKHAAYALSWLRGPKCVASSSSIDRIRVSLESTDLLRFFEANLFSGTEVRNGKPAPDLFLHAAGRMRVQPADCIVVEDSAVGVAAGIAAGMTAIGFVGGSHASANLGQQLLASGARTVIADLRHLKSTVVALRGW
jgi:HAD superfamily hydrolase (TIGR01509 family)